MKKRTSHSLSFGSVIFTIAFLFLSLIGANGEEKKNTKVEKITIEGKDVSLRGSVKDKSGAPIGDVKIKNWYPFGSNAQEALTKSDGTYYFSKHHGYVFSAEKAPYPPSFVEMKNKYNDFYNNKAPLTIDFVLTDGCEFSGKVFTGMEKTPVSGAKVFAERWANDTDVGCNRYIIWTSEPCVSDEAGRYKIKGIPTGVVRIRVQHPNYAENVSADFEMKENEKKETDVGLYAGTKIIFTVQDKESGEPIENAYVNLWDYPQLKTDEKGICEIDHLPKKAYYIVIKAENYHSIDMADFKIEDESGIKEITIKLAREEKP